MTLLYYAGGLTSTQETSINYPWCELQPGKVTR